MMALLTSLVKIFRSGGISTKNALERDKKLLRVLGVTRKSWQGVGSYISLSLLPIFIHWLWYQSVLLTKTARKSQSRSFNYLIGWTISSPYGSWLSLLLEIIPNPLSLSWLYSQILKCWLFSVMIQLRKR